MTINFMIIIIFFYFLFIIIIIIIIIENGKMSSLRALNSVVDRLGHAP